MQAGCCEADTRCALLALACPPLPVGPADATGSPIWLWPPTDTGQDMCQIVVKKKKKVNKLLLRNNNLNGCKGAVCEFLSPLLAAT